MALEVCELVIKRFISKLNSASFSDVQRKSEEK